METKKCNTCRQELPQTLQYFYSNGYTPKGTRKLKPNCKSCEQKNKYSRYYSIMQKVFGTVQCEICGYDRVLHALELHHLDPSEKELEPSQMKSFQEDTIVQEMKKCQLLCANCHREAHYINLDLSSVKHYK